MKTSAIRKHDPAWHILDADNAVLGRLATKAATLLRGKNKTTFLPNMDCGDHVVVVNAGKVFLTGTKLQTKAYYHHSWHPGGLKTEYAKDLITTNPEKMIVNAVKGMLPKNKLQNEWLKRLHVYAGSEHPHMANVAPVEAKK